MEPMPATYDEQKTSEPEERVCSVCGEPISRGTVCRDCKAVENRRDDW